MSENLKFEVKDGIARIVLSRPERRNAFTFDMIDQWCAALEICRIREDISVIVVTGEGKAFCSGGDVIEMADRLDQSPEQRKAELFERIQRIPLTLEDIDKPVIAAVNGAATGAGMDLALMCDLRFASTTARFSETYVNVGLVPGAGGTHFLPRIVGPAKALELFWTGDFIDAQEAFSLGIVNRVFEPDDLDASVMDIARKIAAAPPQSVRLMKRAVYRGLNSDLRTSLDMISSHYAVVTASKQHRALVKTFIDRA